MRSSRILPDEAAELLDLLVVQPAGGLVEQQQLRLRHERPRELDPLQRAEREPRHGPRRDLPEADVVERLARLGLDVAAARVRADEDVLEHRHRPEELDVLERARDPAPDDLVHGRLQERLAGELDLALVRRVEPGDDVEGRRLAGAVRPDQADDLTLGDVEGDAVEGDDPAEPASDVPQREQGHRPAYLIRVGSQMAKEPARRPERRLLSSAVSEHVSEIHESR